MRPCAQCATQALGVPVRHLPCLPPPLQVVLTTALSLVGDVFAIGQLGLGVAGAACTTIIAQYTAVGLLLRALARSTVRPAIQLPARSDLVALLKTFTPLALFYVTKNGCYLLLQSTAARMSALLLAAHQPVWSVWARDCDRRALHARPWGHDRGPTRKPCAGRCGTWSRFPTPRWRAPRWPSSQARGGRRGGTRCSSSWLWAW